MAESNIDDAVSTIKDSTKQKILLCLYVEKAAVAEEVAKEAGVPTKQVVVALSDLTKQGLVKRVALSQGNFYSLSTSGSKLVGVVRNLKTELA